MDNKRILLSDSGVIPDITESLSSGIAGVPYLRPKYPLVASLPVTVVDGASYRLDGAPVVEYLGVGGVWVPQGGITLALWGWNGSEWVMMDNYLVNNDGFILTDAGGMISVDTDSMILVSDDGFILTDDNGNILEV